ncbi:enoyl-CoA hydratase/isomerase family protein [Nocardioides sp. zg-ZUI104]|uniref:enoyl-CoA hydratase-related protein n=1 Tax=Nocardioides faecalis TaxID=2803858 RepID=UPI001BCD2BE0|nr:enoyl-CoA hydratase-related protein [Nocardioides faecalis]MBS4754465.1 enoyl-CoA hydratase/isomerase family protein [Nocardioides faecalis]
MTDAPAELVHLDVADGVATITLDSPHNRNALSKQLVTELADRLATADADDAVRVITLVSSGRVFCSGADLSEASTVPMHEGARAIVGVQRAIVAAGKPVVVVVEGAARAGGIGIVAAADVAIVAEDATFALTEVKLGLTPAVISLTVFPRLTPRGLALTALGGEVFTGTQAAEYGLVTLAVPADELAAKVDEVVGQLATGAPQGLRETKRLLSADLLARIDAGAEEMIELSARLFGSAEAREAMKAFLSRKK